MGLVCCLVISQFGQSLGLILTSQAAEPTHTLPLTLPQQQIKGFGYSSVEAYYPTSGYRNLTQLQRAELDNPLLDELKMNTVRYWGDIDNFVRDYGQMYQNVKDKTQYHLYQAYIKDTNYTTEASRVAIGLKNLKNQNINITHVSVCNECENIPLQSWPQLIISLKQALVEQGLSDIKIVAPEGPNNDGFWMDRIKELKNNSQSWAALDVISSHSYSMSMRPEDRDFKATSGKEWWIGESSDNGSEEVGDVAVASQSISKMIHDYNHGVDNWIWFIGHALNDTNDNKTRILKYSQPAFSVEKLEKFYYFKQFRSLFPNGSRIYNTVSSTENEMPWTYANYAKLQATGAKNTDGTWSLAVTNVASNSNETAKFKINELAGQSNLVFDVYRNNNTQRGVLTETVSMVNGEIVIPNGVGMRELVTLKSRPIISTTSSTQASSQITNSAQSSIIANSNSAVSSQVSSQTVLTFGVPSISIKGTLGKTDMSQIILIGNDYPVGTIANFVPAGSSTVITGTVQQLGSYKIFLPTFGQTIPIDSSVGNQSGTLTMGNRNTNVLTNFSTY